MRLRRELHPVVRQDGVRPIRQLVGHPAREFGGDHAPGPRIPFGKSRFDGAVDGHKKVLLAFLGQHFREIDAQVAKRGIFEFLFRRPLPGFRSAAGG